MIKKSFIFEVCVLNANPYLRVCLAGHTVAMVIYSVMKMIPTCSPIIGQFRDTLTLASTGKEYYNDPSKSTSWKIF